MSVPLIATGLTRHYASAASPAVREVSLRANPGEMLVLVGPSGCGKTTTLRLLAGFERPDAGTISLGEQILDGPGVHVPPERRGIGIVFQDYALFPHLDVLGNVAYGLKSRSKAERTSRAMEVLAEVGLRDLAQRRPHDLSGGEQQRVALARALAPQPQVLLLDEPYSNLDTHLRHQLREQLRQLVQTTGIAIVLVTHDQEEALHLADQLAVMDGGRVIQSGPPEEVYHAPRTRFVATFLGGTNLIAGIADGLIAQTPLGRLPLRVDTHGECWLSVRPEAIVLVGIDPGLPQGEVVDRRFSGSEQQLHVQCGELLLDVRLASDSPLRPGDRVSVQVAGPAVVVE